MKVDKTNGDVKYNDEHHIYWNDNGDYVSVTTLIGFYKNKFDSHFWSSYKALEFIIGKDLFEEVKHKLLNTKVFDISLLSRFNIEEEVFNTKRSEILTSYDTERDSSCERGTKIHAELENKFYTKQKHNIEKEFNLPGTFTCNPNYYELDLDKGIYPEYLISLSSRDGKLKVAGQIDLLIKDGNDIILWDWKTNKKIDNKSFYNKNTRRSEVLKFPLNNIQDCNLMHYTLQLSAYAYTLQQINPELNIKELNILHIDHDNKRTVIKIDYLKDDVERMFKHYKQHFLMQKELAKDSPIIY